MSLEEIFELFDILIYTDKLIGSHHPEMLVLFKNSKSFQFEKTSNWAGHWSALSDFEEYTHCGNSSFVGVLSFLLLVTEQVAFIAAVLGSTALHLPKSIQPLGQGHLNFSPNLLSVQAQLQSGKREEWGEARCLQLKKEKRRKQTLSDGEVFKNTGEDLGWLQAVRSKWEGNCPTEYVSKSCALVTVQRLQSHK